MNTLRKSIVIAVASLGLGTVALAAPDPGAERDGRGCHWGAFGGHGAKSAEHVAKRQAALHDKLGLSPAQEPAWKAFTERSLASIAAKAEARPDAAMTAPERADRAVAFLQAAQQQAAARAQTIKEFYVVLSPEQQKIFDSQFQGRRHHSRHG